jgi:hypothetical protein
MWQQMCDVDDITPTLNRVFANLLGAVVLLFILGGSQNILLVQDDFSR